jgi:signal transduction histidine kinase
MTPPSIRARLANALLGWSLLCALGLALAVGLTARHEVDELLDETLQSTSTVLARALTVFDAAGANGAAVIPTGGEGELAWQVVGAEGQVLRRSANAPAAALVPPGSVGLHRTSDWRVHAVALGGADGRMLIVAHTLEERAEARGDVILSGVLAALSIGLLGYLWLRVRVRSELQPLDHLVERLAQHDPLDPQRALGAAERAELAPVHAAIDQLGARLAQRVARERMVTAHAAHALRTPLAGMDAQLAVALRESTPEARPRLQRVREASARLQHVVRSLLELFRLDKEVQRQAVELKALLAHLPVAGLEVVVPDGARVEADADLLAGALANLLDNAQRHGARRVVVSLPAAQCVRLHNDGQGIDAQRRQALAAALQAQRYEGETGLGLMLADLVARAHRGRLNLPEVSAGFAVELSLAPQASGR